MSFSKRMGYEPEKKALQLDSIDNELRTDIYNFEQGATVLKILPDNSSYP
ncbi:MAG: hypothetical protein RBS43_05480 [Candidatus Cloacimonas sp.]|jgi:hypothetical protein|nr:hypothetical protein [Candidatus Cloacimonas sp.]